MESQAAAGWNGVGGTGDSLQKRRDRGDPRRRDDWEWSVGTLSSSKDIYRGAQDSSWKDKRMQ